MDRKTEHQTAGGRPARQSEQKSASPHGDGGDVLRRPAPQEFDIRIATDGSWYHEGGLIGRPALVKLFASVLRREADGSYWLVTPVERGRIDVDDVPFIIIAAECEGDGEDQVIRLRSNVDDDIILGAAHQLVMRSPPDGDDLRPYVTVRPGIDGRLGLEGRIARPVFYELAERGVEGPQGQIGIWSAGTFFSLEGGEA
jgi:hypothetical protein